MDLSPIKVEIYRERVAKLQEMLRSKGLQAFLILTHENYRYFIGDLRHQPRAIIPAEGEPILIIFTQERKEVSLVTWVKDIRTYNHVGEMMKAVHDYFADEKFEKVAVEYLFSVPYFLLDRFKRTNPQVEMVNGNDLFFALRMIKSPEEIARIEKASNIADAALKKALEVLRDNLDRGLTENELAAEVEYFMRKEGAESTSFPTFINSGIRAYSLHGNATAKTIEADDVIVINLGPKVEGYGSNLARTVVVGKATQEQKQLYEIQQEAQRLVLEALRPGIKINQLDQIVKKHYAAHDLGKYYLGGFSHSLGLAFEETPMPTIFPRDSVIEVRENMVLALGHPILSVSGRGAARLEDTVHVTADGFRPLTKSIKELVEI